MRYYPHGLPAKLLAFFQANPTEELSYGDIAAKFALSYASARRAVAALKRGGELEVGFVVRLAARERRDGT